jgi:hypothetical protein
MASYFGRATQTRLYDMVARMFFVKNQNCKKYTKMAAKMPKGHNLCITKWQEKYQNVTKHTKLFHPKAIQSIPESAFLV